MHFITGGAFNGKRAWVKKNYGEAEWISAYKGEQLNEDLKGRTVVVLEGLELWVKDLTAKMPIQQVRAHFRRLFEDFQEWENSASNRQIVFIGTDITKGIVPMEKANRDWRDVTGWVYQDLSAMCRRVDIIWYGLNRTLKGEGI